MIACVFCGALELHAVGLCVPGGSGQGWCAVAKRRRQWNRLALKAARVGCVLHHIAMPCLKVFLLRPLLTGLRDLVELCSPQNIWRNATLSIAMCSWQVFL